MLLAATKAPLLLGVLGEVLLVVGFVAGGLLAVYVIKRAPKDGSDIGRDPRLNPDEHRRRNGDEHGPRRPSAWIPRPGWRLRTTRKGVPKPKRAAKAEAVPYNGRNAVASR